MAPGRHGAGALAEGLHFIHKLEGGGQRDRDRETLREIETQRGTELVCVLEAIVEM